MAGFYLSAAHKSSGKTTLGVAILAALQQRGVAAAPFKKGPDYIDPLWLAMAAGRPCRNLDFHTQSPIEIEALFRTHAQGVAVVEGNKGLYDGMDPKGKDSNAALAKLLGLPVVLVLDCRGTTRGVAPLLMGYQAFDADVRFGGVILNRVGGTRHEGKLVQAVETYTDFKILGSVPEQADLAIVERYLGLVPANESGEADQVIARLGAMAQAHIDLDALAALGPALTPTPPPPSMLESSLRIGIAKDSAFAFYYQDDLDALASAGAELVPINFLSDSTLPALDGLFIGGGFPEQFMVRLEANASLRNAVREAVEAGLPTYAECGGLMYLCRAIQWGDQRSEMAGVLPADVVMGSKPVGRGYVYLQETSEHPWGGTEGSRRIAAHEFHYSSLKGLPEYFTMAYDVERGFGINGRADGVVYRNLLASYSHLRSVGSCRWAQRFVAFVRQCRDKSQGETI